MKRPVFSVCEEVSRQKWQQQHRHIPYRAARPALVLNVKLLWKYCFCFLSLTFLERRKKTWTIARVSGERSFNNPRRKKTQTQAVIRKENRKKTSKATKFNFYLNFFPSISSPSSMIIDSDWKNFIGTTNLRAYRSTVLAFGDRCLSLCDRKDIFLHPVMWIRSKYQVKAIEKEMAIRKEERKKQKQKIMSTFSEKNIECWIDCQARERPCVSVCQSHKTEFRIDEKQEN